MEDADKNKRLGIKTIVFVDEIHRFNKAQQDAFLPYVEKGSIVLIGATTENPSFEVNNALLSRCRVFVLKELSTEDIETLIKRTLKDERGFGKEKIKISKENIHLIAELSSGDARSALATLDMLVLNGNINKKLEIELFNFGINFYKRQMDIINFFNIIILTQIMLTQQSEKKHNILSQKIELSIN